MMEQHLPKVYLAFRDAYPEVTQALDELGRSTERAGPLDDRTQRLVKVALAVGALAEGAVRSNVRKALAAGDSAAEIRHVALLAITTCGFPTAIAGLGWMDEVLGPVSADGGAEPNVG
jgi:4-carboxymuconolactone decarboxylase